MQAKTIVAVGGILAVVAVIAVILYLKFRNGGITQTQSTVPEEPADTVEDNLPVADPADPSDPLTPPIPEPLPELPEDIPSTWQIIPAGQFMTFDQYCELVRWAQEYLRPVAGKGEIAGWKLHYAAGAGALNISIPGYPYGRPQAGLQGRLASFEITNPGDFGVFGTAFGKAHLPVSGLPAGISGFGLGGWVFTQPKISRQGAVPLQLDCAAGVSHWKVDCVRGKIVETGIYQTQRVLTFPSYAKLDRVCLILARCVTIYFEDHLPWRISGWPSSLGAASLPLFSSEIQPQMPVLIPIAMGWFDENGVEVGPVEGYEDLLHDDLLSTGSLMPGVWEGLEEWIGAGAGGLV